MIDRNYNFSYHLALAMLFQEIFLFAKEHGVDYIFTGAPIRTVSIINDLNFKTLDNFKYSPEDVDKVYCSVFDMSDTSLLDTTIKGLADKKYTLNFF